MMTVRIFLSAALVALIACAAPPTNAAKPTEAPTETPAKTEIVDRPAESHELQTFCETAACRHDLRVRLRRDKGEPYDETFELLPPAVQDSMVTIHPGEKISAVPLFEGDRFTGWRATRPDETADTQILTIDLSQSKDNTSMMAHVSTNTGPALKLRMGLVRLDGNDRPEPTSSCPLQAGGFSSFEMWPYPIFVLIVADAKRLADSDTMTCE
jgi:hypothetical protein